MDCIKLLCGEAFKTHHTRKCLCSEKKKKTLVPSISPVVTDGVCLNVAHMDLPTQVIFLHISGFKGH